MLCITASAPSKCRTYEEGSSTSPFCHDTLLAHSGGSGEEETEAQCGLPEREMEVTDQFREAAARQMREPVCNYVVSLRVLRLELLDKNETT